MTEHADWPALAYEDWAATKKTLQMCAQMLGKTKLALMPPQPEWLHACLYLDARGFSTGPMPAGSRVLTCGIDVFAGTMWIRSSDGRESAVPIGPDRCVAEIWAQYASSFADLGIHPDIWDKPQELTDVTPFGENRHDCTLDAEQAQRFHRVLCSINSVFEEFRSSFFGRSGVQFWWGAFDLTVLLFNGEHAVAPDDRGYIMRYDLDAEHMNAGFWPGDDSAPSPGFYAYIVPQPEGCAVAPIAPAHAGWVESMGEWLMPYDAVRTCDDPRAAILEFLASVYGVAVSNAGWDAGRFAYATPPAPSRS
jgi:hypothetical protein